MRRQSGHDPARRQVLGGSAALVASAMIAGAATAARQNIGTARAARPSLLLHDPRFPLADAVRRLHLAAAQIVPLLGDPMRLWRSSDGAALRDPASCLLGISGWDGLLIFRGLAAESRRHLRYERFDPGSGAFVWLLA